ncbi:MAG: chromate resistance protein ChrB [Reyranella sp.]|uniref:Chromate resistance protein ChrB n=1 Tax=Reyranella sp. TaxID=1929291 RepID=UPI001ACDA20D|nr:Chromate resistance protein ChrB [Reyranella sp.]MBN9089020.1 chromate resistance protein ChrB [Reyranella sp.]
MSAPLWLLLTYKVPPEPARLRIALWRKIKALGAVYLQNGICVLPRTDEHLRRLKVMENEIARMGGEAVLLETVPLDRTQQRKVLDRFNADRNEAYQEFIERCEGFEAEIARETAAGKLTFAELEENDEDLKKLRTWFDKIRKLDFHGASQAEEAAKRLADCNELLDRFARQVFEAQEENRTPAMRRAQRTKQGK